MKHRLAVAYDINSSSPIEIIKALGESFELIWLVDRSQPLGPMGAIVSRLGTVVDLAGLPPDSAIAEVGAARPEGIVTFVDSQLPTASMIAAGLGLPFHSSTVTRRFLDKYAQREALRESGLVVPGFVAIPTDASAAQIAELTAGIEFPAVLKPRSGFESRDTYQVESAGRVLELLAPPHGDRGAPSGDYVLEEYLPDTRNDADRAVGDYVSVESVVVAGRAHHLGVTGKFPLEPHFRETGNFMPSLLAADEEAAVLTLAGQAVAALGVEHGSLHTEIKMTPAGLRVIELNARVGGGGIEDLFVMSYGQSLRHIAAMAALGIDPPADMRLQSAAVAYQLFVQPPVGARLITRMDGLDAVSALPGVEQISPALRVGGETDWRQGSGGYVVSVRGSVPDHDALRSMRAEILERLVLGYD